MYFTNIHSFNAHRQPYEVGAISTIFRAEETQRLSKLPKITAPLGEGEILTPVSCARLGGEASLLAFCLSYPIRVWALGGARHLAHRGV